MPSRWRQIAEPIVREIVAQFPEDCPERRKALKEAYPFGERAYWPYTMWLKVVREFTQPKPSKPLFHNDQHKLMES